MCWQSAERERIMILLTIGSVILLITGILLANYSNGDGFLFPVSFIVSILSGGALLFILIGWPANYFTNLDGIQQYYATQQTIEQARVKGIDSIERAALTQKVIETNQWLASTQYWNKTIFDRAVPDEIETLKPLK
jgi:hypothetical protein